MQHNDVRRDDELAQHVDLISGIPLEPLDEDAHVLVSGALTRPPTIRRVDAVPDGVVRPSWRLCADARVS
jgi:hypothetical protein